MKRMWFVALSAALTSATMALAVDDASAARYAGVNRARVHAGGINRYHGAVYHSGVNRRGIAYRQGWSGGNRVWNGNYWDRPGMGVAAAGLAISAASASAAYDYGTYNNYGSYDSRYYPLRAEYRSLGYAPASYIGPICNPQFDSLCQ